MAIQDKKKQEKGRERGQIYFRKTPISVCATNMGNAFMLVIAISSVDALDLNIVSH
jgi:hypothetical protein